MTCEAGDLHLGIDLGASRSTVCSSDGSHHFFDCSLDSLLDILIDPKKDPATPTLSGKILSDLIAPSPGGDERKVRAVVAVSNAVAPQKQRSLYRSFAGAVDNLLLIPDLLAVAYGMDFLADTMIIDIGATRTDFCILAGHLPSQEDQPSLAIAGSSIDRQLVANLAQRYPELPLPLDQVRSWKERHAFVGPRAQRILVSTTVDGADDGVRVEIDITDAMRLSCESILPPLIGTMLDLLQSCTPACQQAVRQNILLTGGSSLIHGLASRIESALRRTGGGRVRRLVDPTFAAARGSLAMANDLSDSAWNQLALA